MDEQELRALGRSIVSASKSSARVDTGRLKRSISYVINLQGVLTFTEVFYGQFGDNSDLEENINAMMPEGIAWQLIYTDDNGTPYQVVRSTQGGRVSVTKATKATTRNTLGIGGIKNFLKRITGGKKED